MKWLIYMTLRSRMKSYEQNFEWNIIKESTSISGVNFQSLLEQISLAHDSKVFAQKLIQL